MAAPKAREVVTINRDDSGNVVSVAVRVTGEWQVTTVNVADLPRVELMRVVAQVWPGKRDWRRYGNDAIQLALTDGVLPDVVSQDDEPMNQDEPIKLNEPMSQDEPTTQTQPTTDSGSGDPLAVALRSAMRSIASDTVNEQQVRNIVKNETQAIIDEAVADIARPQITMIQVNQQEPVQVAGRTHRQFQQVITAMGAGEHLMLVGPPGTGKTFIAEQAAESLGLPFYSIQCHAQMPASQIWGYMNATGEYVRTLFREAYEHGGVFLFDEIDNGNSNVLASMNAALANGVCAFPDSMVKKCAERPMVIVAAGNTYGTGPDALFVGRNALDAATIDRFTRLTIGVDDGLESDIAHALSSTYATEWLSTVRRYREKAEAHNLRIIVSPRATFSGIKLLEAGWSKHDVVEARILAGLTSDQRAKLAGS